MTEGTTETAAPTLPTTPPSVILDADATTISCTTASIFKPPSVVSPLHTFMHFEVVVKSA